MEGERGEVEGDAGEHSRGRGEEENSIQGDPPDTMLEEGV